MANRNINQKLRGSRRYTFRGSGQTRTTTAEHDHQTKLNDSGDSMEAKHLHHHCRAEEKPTQTALQTSPQWAGERDLHTFQVKQARKDGR